MISTFGDPLESSELSEPHDGGLAKGLPGNETSGLGLSSMSISISSSSPISFPNKPALNQFPSMGSGTPKISSR